MNISPSRIKQSIDPISFYFDELGISPSSSGIGWYVAGLCPFHEDKHEGSFRVNFSSGSFICFACGSKGGDIIAFTQRRYELSFSEAMHQLSKEWRVYVPSL